MNKPLDSLPVILIFILLLTTAGITPVFGDQNPDKSPAGRSEITWVGCGVTKNAFMEEIAKAYEKKTGHKIIIYGGGATRGIRAASADGADMGGTCRHWLLDDKGNKLPEEKNAALIPVAWDAIVAVVHPDNPINNISLDRLEKIFAGEIKFWKDLGGWNKRIALVTREGKYSGVGHMFRLMVFNDPEYEFKVRSFIVKSTGPLEIKIGKTPTALGLDGVSSARKAEVKILSIDGIFPSKENIASGKYPLFRPLYIAVHDEISSRARDVVDFILSPEGQAIISYQGTVNLQEGKALEAPWKKQKVRFGP